jgi:hypothetical protein
MSETLTVRDPFSAIRALVLDSVSSAASKRSYRASLAEFCSFLDHTGQCFVKLPSSPTGPVSRAVD